MFYKLFFFKQKTAYEMRISDWSSDVCSSDLPYETDYRVRLRIDGILKQSAKMPVKLNQRISARLKVMSQLDIAEKRVPQDGRMKINLSKTKQIDFRSEEHTSELQSLMRISYAVFCLKKKTTNNNNTTDNQQYDD